MTRRDRTTRRRAKGLWTGVSGRQTHARRDMRRLLPVGANNALLKGLLVAYKPHESVTKIAIEIRFEAVLGKTRRTEF